MGTVQPDPQHLQAFLNETDDRPIRMLNLLRFRDQAQYAEGFNAEPCSGVEAYQRYSRLAGPCVAAVGGHMLWQGDVLAGVIAPPDEIWHKAFIVEYPSRKAFIAMLMNEDYRACVPHRTAALDDSRLIATGEPTS